MTSLPRLLVDIVADPVCPWCYVGLKSFAAARADLAKTFDLLPRYRPYQLNPDTPAGGADRNAYYAKKFPDRALRDRMRIRLTEAAREAGAPFDPATPKRLPNTLAAHRVLRWAHFTGRQDSVATALYDGYWREGEDIGDIRTLARLAATAGMDEADAAARLETDEDAEIVAREAEAFRAAGVRGVPIFIVNEKTGFSGALPPASLAKALKQAAA